ncbi:hypothetical protein M413DRAFT_443182 [Hebeloma cylindrosporum]|uniref:C2H2-type domain-containing protein n=1 Tax=Hebeloma cylindrosporum TaxID=76867 RepID=A0A0C3C5M8_HEBCY|nr:hypothetical protein M413DRAFT_443182 [Hebeloma cylindrosporum h7]
MENLLRVPHDALMQKVYDASPEFRFVYSEMSGSSNDQSFMRFIQRGADIGDPTFESTQASQTLPFYSQDPATAAESLPIIPYVGQTMPGDGFSRNQQLSLNFCPFPTCWASILQHPGELTTHLRNTHFIRNEGPKKQTLELQLHSIGACPFPFCGAPIERPRDAMKHLRSVHFNGNGVQISSCNSLEYSETGRFICEVPGCGASILIRDRSFVNHYKEHFIRYFCPVNGCDYHAGRRNLLARHARLRHGGMVDVRSVLSVFVTGFY